MLETRQAFADIPTTLSPQFRVRFQWRISAADPGPSGSPNTHLRITHELEWLASSWLKKMVEKATLEVGHN